MLPISYLSIIMKRLAIFTVKRVILHQGSFYSYGGFFNSNLPLTKKFRVTVFCRVRSLDFIPIGWSKVPTVFSVFPLYDTPNLVLRNFSFLHDLLSLKSFPIDFDVVECRIPDFTGFTGFVFANTNNIPFYFQTVGDYYSELRSLNLFRVKNYFLALFYIFFLIFERLIVKKSSPIIFQGKKPNRFKNSNFLITSSSTVSEGDIITSRKFLFSETKRLRLIHVARMTGVKNQDYLISSFFELFNKLNSRGIKAELIMVGDGPRLSKLKTLVRSLNLEPHVRFLGRIKNGKALYEVLDQSDYFVLTSRSEGTPKVILEAMARGLPVIHTNVGGIPFIVQNTFNYTINLEDYKALSSLTDLLLSKEHFSRASNSNLKKMKELTVEYLTNEKYEFISKLI